jgi:ketosteroid isomerase-like protein
MPDIVVTRVPTDGPPRRPRTLDERLMVRLPGLYRRQAILLSRLSPRSRVRRAALRRASISGWAAFNRRDFELMVVRYAPDVEFQFAPGQQALGLSGTYRGPEEMRAAIRDMAGEWDAIELQPAYVVDLGEMGLGLGFLRARGRASGVQVETEFAQMITVRDGLVASDRAWFTWEEGLREAGLDPEAISLART